MATEPLFERKGTARPKPATKADVARKVDTPQPSEALKRPLSVGTINQAQQTLGNKAVQRLIQRKAQGEPTELNEETAAAINSARGQGQSLDSDMADKAGGAMGQDFSNVKIHTDSQSDQLNEQVGAKAFTTGNDIFFSSGAYDPHSQDGQHLIAHELTHVVQQGASAPAVQGKMTVNDPNDQYEAEADQVADQVISQPQVQKEEMPEEELQTKRIQREEMPEEEVQTMRIQREEMPEEEVQTKLIQREEMPEEEVQTMSLQREEMPEEEMVE